MQARPTILLPDGPLLSGLNLETFTRGIFAGVDTGKWHNGVANNASVTSHAFPLAGIPGDKSVKRRQGWGSPGSPLAAIVYTFLHALLFFTNNKLVY